MEIEWVYLAGCLIIGYCAYRSGKGDGVNLGIEQTLTLLEKHNMISVSDPKFDEIFTKKKLDR